MKYVLQEERKGKNKNVKASGQDGRTGGKNTCVLILIKSTFTLWIYVTFAKVAVEGTLIGLMLFFTMYYCG